MASSSGQPPISPIIDLPNPDSTAVPVVAARKKSTVNPVFEPREMYVQTSQADVDVYGSNFLDGYLKGDALRIQALVRPMCHALRYWLADKFCRIVINVHGYGRTPKGTLGRPQIREIFGIKYDCMIQGL